MAVNDCLAVLKTCSNGKAFCWEGLWNVYSSPDCGNLANWPYVTIAAIVTVAIISKTENPYILLIAWIFGSYIVSSYLQAEITGFIFISASMMLASLIYKTLRSE